MECNDIQEPELLVTYFRSNHEPTLSRVLRCFRNLFYSDYKGLSYKRFFSYKPNARDWAEELMEEGFNNGLSQFYFFIRQNGFKENGATVKSLFFTFCLNQLRALARAKERHNTKYVTSDPSDLFALEPDADIIGYNTVREELRQLDQEARILQNALNQLGERSANLIIWRKVERLDNAEIARRTGLDPSSVNNEVYRAFIKLKKIVDLLRLQN